MAATMPRDTVIAVIGDGFGSLIVHATARYLGFTPEQIAVYGTSGSPIQTYAGFARNLGQTVLRSESESHFLPADWPTFAQLDAWARRSPRPLLRSIRRRYNPGLEEVMAEAQTVGRRLDWDGVRVPTRIGWVQREMTPEPHLVLFDEEARMVGRARHVMIALGHGPLAFPPVVARAREVPGLAERIVQAYEPKAYVAGGRYIVVGAGIASVNEWVNALDAGGKVVSLLRSPVPDEQDLNTPRCLFEAMGIDAYQGLDFDARIRFLGQILKGTSPHRRGWAEVVATGRSQGRFEELTGEIDRIEAGPAGLRVHVTGPAGTDMGSLDVSGIVCGTGFNKSPLVLPLVRRLIQHYGVPVAHGKLKLRSNCGLPPLDMERSRVACMGLLANGIVPSGDTIAGLKYVGRRFVSDVARAEDLAPRSFGSRLAMQLSLALDTAHVLRQTRRTSQVA
jgi:hypothetical protein